MKFRFWSVLVPSLICIAALVSQSPSLSAAEQHVVSPAELQQATVTVARTRQQNLTKVEGFFSSNAVKQTLKSAHLDPVQIKKAVPSLSDQELARLASKVDKAQKNFAAGALTNQQITYIIIALATAIIVILAT